jgi:hypothetical protein
MRLRFILFVAAISAMQILTLSSSAQQRTQTTEEPIKGDFKITIKTTTAGQTIQTTTMIKGRRERSETSMAMAGMSGSQVNITQCDMRRIAQINDRTRKYLIIPMDADGSATSAAPSPGQVTNAPREGALVTMTVNTIDTGERREIFGFSARHLKRTAMATSSPDACNQQQMKIEQDGWYINLEYGLNCGSRPAATAAGVAAATGCRDRYQYRHTGPENLGYPLIETTTMYGPNGSVMFTTTKEVVELSRQPLDAAQFDIPPGYTQAQNQQEMNSPSMSDVMGATQQQVTQNNPTPNARTTSAASLSARPKIGVVEFENKTKAFLSPDELRQRLIATLVGDGIEAIPLNAASPAEAEIEARAKGCSHILYTDIALVKTPSTGKRIGGVFSRAAGADSGSAGKAEARLDYRLIKTGATSPVLQSSASGKENNQDESVNAALQAEAQALAGALPKI